MPKEHPVPVTSSIPFTSDDEIRRIGRGLIDRTLPKSEWTHAGHFAAAVCLLADQYINAPRDMPALIRAYNEATGVANTDTTGYHETITQASLRAAENVRAIHPADAPLHAIVNAIMSGACGQPGWLLAYWSKDVLFSPLARRTWVEPDLQPLPF